MLFIIEGSDGSGKSTLLENLRHNSSAPWFIISRTSGPPETHYQIRQFMDMVTRAAQECTVICDRCPAISEAVYGPLYNRPPLPIWETQAMVANANVIYCRPPSKVIREKTLMEPQMEGVVNKVDDIIEGYDRLMLAIRPNLQSIMAYDFTVDRLAQVRKFVFGERP
jgi:hypothetical protein